MNYKVFTKLKSSVLLFNKVTLTFNLIYKVVLKHPLSENYITHNRECRLRKWRQETSATVKGIENDRLPNRHVQPLGAFF